MRRVMVVVLFAFAVTLAAVLGNQMSSDAVAVVVGVVFGVAAGVPTSLLLVLLFSRGTRKDAAEGWGNLGPASNRGGGYPPVIVIQSGTTSAGGLQPPYYSAVPSGAESIARRFHIVGQPEE